MIALHQPDTILGGIGAIDPESEWPNTVDDAGSEDPGPDAAPRLDCVTHGGDGRAEILFIGQVGLLRDDFGAKFLGMSGKETVR